MDLTTARDTLRSKIGSPNTTDVPDSTLTRVINAAYREIGTKYPFNEIRCLTSFPTVVGQPRYNLPTDLAIIRRLWDDTNKRRLRKRGMRYLSAIPKNLVTGFPRDYVRGPSWIQLIPEPDAAYTIDLYYDTSIGDLVADSDTFVLPLAWHDGIVLKARHVYYDERGDIGKAIYAKNEWKDWVSDKPSEIDQEKDDMEDVGVILTDLGGEYGRRGPRRLRYDENFDNEDWR